jgi:1-acyl-sn-glycerol-3-phosphate acyltransferase
MLRSYLIVYPALAAYITIATLIFVPLTWIIGDIRPIYWASRQGVRLALFLAGVKIETVGLEKAWDQKTAVFVCNHITNLDPAALFFTLPRIAVILKKELGRIPLLGYVMKLGSFIYVDRSAPNSRHRALEEAIQTLRRGISLLIFPEGTRSKTNEMLPFRPGPFTMAIEAQVPIVPITVEGARELMPSGSLQIKPGRLKLTFLDPVETTGMTSKDRQDLMTTVREKMEAALAASK